MFYEANPDPKLRFGDILQGFITSTPMINEPIINSIAKVYKIEINSPNYCVILAPCCSIGPKIVSITPLIQIRDSFFDNPYFKEDLTRINRQMEPNFAVPPPSWQEFSEDVKARRLSEGREFALLSLFIYERHDLLPKYELYFKKERKRIDINYYMIDFKNIFNIHCNILGNPGQEINKQLKTAKILQLSIETRNELREKISNYYGRIPKEDIVS